MPYAIVIELAYPGPSVLACGAWLKNTVCVTRGDRAYVSHLTGDLDSADACLMLEQSVARLCAELDVQPEIVAHDLHPDFFSSRFAQAYADQHGLPVVAVQHHHAHIAALCAEHHVTEPVLGLALDGVGLGMDGTSWGGELLWVHGADFHRLGHLAPLAMPGGDRAAREPWRMAAAALFRMGQGDRIAQRFPNQPGAGTIATMLQRGLNCPASSSMGRLFDAAAGLLGVCEVQSAEAEAAIGLERSAGEHGQVDPLDGGYCIAADGELDFSMLLTKLAELTELAGWRNAGYGAALFHATLAAGLADWVQRAAAEHKLTQVAFGGGCFHNAILSQALSDRLAAFGMQVLTARQMPPGDSAISLGQAWVALQSINRGA